MERKEEKYMWYAQLQQRAKYEAGIVHFLTQCSLALHLEVQHRQHEKKYWTTAGSIHMSTAQQTSSNPDCSKNNQPRRNPKGKDPNNKAHHSVQSTASSNHPWISDFPQTKIYRNEPTLTSLKFQGYEESLLGCHAASRANSFRL